MRHVAHLALARLEEEFWGEKLRRARERAGLTLRQAAELVGEVIPTSFRSVARLEEQRDVPTGHRQLVAYIAVLAYGFDPAGFGLVDSSAARLIDRGEVFRTLTEARKRLSIRWYYGTNSIEAA